MIKLLERRKLMSGGGPSEVTVTLYPYDYDTTNISIRSIDNPENAYGPCPNKPSSSSSHCNIHINRTSSAASYIYFKFDTSIIPQNAIIQSVYCRSGIAFSNTISSTGVASQVSVATYSSTTQKDIKTYTKSVYVNSSDCVSVLNSSAWTRSELDDVRLRLYAKRTNRNYNSTDATISFYGSELVITYISA